MKSDNLVSSLVVVNGTCGLFEARILIRQPEYTANINEPINDNAKNKIEKDVFVDGLIHSLIRCSLIQSCSGGAENFTKYLLMEFSLYNFMV